MSLTDKVAKELCSLSANKSCCQKALLCGLLYGCKADANGGSYSSFFYRESDARRGCEIIQRRFSGSDRTAVSACTRGGHRGYTLTFSSKALASVFSDIDSGRAKSIADAVGFRCADCSRHFLGGVFCSCATLSQPKNGYHLEFSVPTQGRARLFSDLLEEYSARPAEIVRKNKIGLYYKSNGKISDILYLIGATKASFTLANFSIERDIRNNENRATNCVTSNISRSVEATRKQIEAVRLLISKHKLSALGEELEYTARLRLEYDAASLSELAMLHQPPISKSGLNGRMRRILEAAQELDKS